VADTVRITDVSPRDGLQNEPGVISTQDKVRLIELLAVTGVDEIEATSFVSPKWVPQLGDAGEVVKGLANLPLPEGGGRGVGSEGDASRRAILSALVPNERGMQSLLDANLAAGAMVISKVAVFTAASETFSRKNTNASIAETIERFGPVVKAAAQEGLEIRAYISCAIACPFEGPTAPAKVVEVAGMLLELGVDEIDLGDTIGAGTHESTEALLRGYDEEFSIGPTAVPLTMHFHDTFGRAAECVRVSLERGVRSFDGSAGGLGGCPYASTRGTRAPGNIATELLVRTVHAAGLKTGVDLDALERAGEHARRIVAAARG
jgi:hydroxymethylglutaryl-CoA lyase